MCIDSISAQRWCRISVERWCFILILPNGVLEYRRKFYKDLMCTNVGLFLCSLLFIIIEYFLRQRFSCFHSWKQKDGYLWSERWPRKVIKWESMFSLKNDCKRKEFLDVNPRIQTDHRESCLTNVFHVLSMQKTDKSFRALFNEFLSCTLYEEIF